MVESAKRAGEGGTPVNFRSKKSRWVHSPAARVFRQVEGLAVGEGFGDVAAGDAGGAFEVGQGAGDAQHPVIAARREAQALGGALQRAWPAASGVAISSRRAPSASALVRMRRSAGSGIARALPGRAAATRRAISALVSAGGGRPRSAGDTAGTSMCMSMRSSSGPLRREV